MDAHLTMRELEDGDWDAVLALANEGLPQAPDANAGWLEARQAFAASGRAGRHYIGERDGQPVVFVALEGDGDARFRVFLVMRPDRLGDGTGDAAFAALLRDLDALGASVSWMREEASDTTFLAWLATQGFRETARFAPVGADAGVYRGVPIVTLELHRPAEGWLRPRS